MNKLIGLLCCAALLAGCDMSGTASHDEHDDHAAGEAEQARGPNGGRVLEDGAFALDLAIFEAGVPPEFHAWITDDGAPVAPADVALTVTLTRLGGEVNRIEFVPQGNFLRGTAVVHEPHSFDVVIEARRGGQTHRFAYESYEGRTQIAADVARTAGIGTTTAGPATITDDLTLYGAIAVDATRVREVGARFPGVIRSVNHQVGDRVRAGEALATVESNESLQAYTVTAPIAGIVTERHAAPGEQTDSTPLFALADFSTVWAELDVFSRDRTRLREGLPVTITAEGGAAAAGTISYLAPTGNRASQSVAARVVLDNADGRWTPGQFVEAHVAVGATPVALGVPLSALQRFREFDVVFAQVGDVYEVRMLTLGRRDNRFVEVQGGLAPGTVIVSDNSYLIKADIEKAGASHDH